MSKKILIITSEFPPEPGGIGNHAYNLAKYLSKNTYNVTVLSDQRIEKDSAFDKKQSFKVYRTQLKKIRFLMYFSRVFLALKLIKNNEVIITSGKFSLWIGALATFFFNRKYLAVIHGTEVNYKSKILHNSINFSLKRHNTIVAVSNYTKSLVSNLDLKRCVVINNGFEAFGKEVVIDKKISSSPNLVTIGSVTERKGQINVIKALPYLIEEFPAIHYHIVGTPKEKEVYIEIAKKIKVEKHITFYGKVSDVKKQKVLQQSDIFVMLSNNTSTGDVEGFGIAILEANSLGLPAIGSKNCGIEDAVEEGFSGCLIDPKDYNGFKESINKLLKDKNFFNKNAREWSKEFTWNNVINKYINEIEV